MSRPPPLASVRAYIFGGALEDLLLADFGREDLVELEQVLALRVVHVALLRVALQIELNQPLVLLHHCRLPSKLT